MAALGNEERCAAAKNTEAGKYYSCRQKAAARAVRAGIQADYDRCKSKFTWSRRCG